MTREILIGQVYHHFKGNDYEALNIAIHTETEEKMVVYKDLKNEKVWVRPYEMFNSLVDTIKYPDVKQKYRFELKK
jgi:hypothetical protein